MLLRRALVTGNHAKPPQQLGTSTSHLLQQTTQPNVEMRFDANDGMLSFENTAVKADTIYIECLKTILSKGLGAGNVTI
jgi:hypothetical protein